MEETFLTSHISGKTISFGHDGGFTSNCCVMLYLISRVINCQRSLPAITENELSFAVYREAPTEKNTFHHFFKPEESITHELACLLNSDSVINFDGRTQFTRYSEIDFSVLNPIVRHYFKPQDAVVYAKETLKRKYAIEPFETCVLFYRGNDKVKETSLCSYAEILEEAGRHTGRFWLQSDETGFLEHLRDFPDGVVFWDEIVHVKSDADKQIPKLIQDRPDKRFYAINFLAIMLLMSECRVVICNHSGNCSLWICLFRGNSDGVFQWHDGKFIGSG